MHYNFVKASNRRYLEELKNLTKEMPVVYQSVNIMQHTEWVINKPIYEVIKQCMDNDFPLGKLPVNPQTIELPDENEQSSVVTEDVDDLDEFDDLFNDLDEEEDDLDSFLDDFE